MKQYIVNTNKFNNNCQILTEWHIFEMFSPIFSTKGIFPNELLKIRMGTFSVWSEDAIMGKITWSNVEPVF